MQPIIIYSPQTSPRLNYVLDWLFTEQLKTDYILVHTEQEITSGAFTISYGAISKSTLSIPSTDLLWEQGIKPQDIGTGIWTSIPTLFAVNDDKYTLSFDIFSAIFFLLSRFEEYYNYTPDKYGRYPATESILYKHNLLHRPILDEWVHQFRLLLTRQYYLQIPEQTFTYQPTYDIDIAYSYLHKGFIRNIGGLTKNLLSWKTALVAERLKVLRGSKKDPYDSFSFLAQLHKTYNYSPRYFILAALQNTPYDKNILPGHSAMRSLLKQLVQEGQIGMHPSFYTDTNAKTWLEEKNTLEHLCGQSIKISRQHYIKMKLPDTYRFLENNGISEDYSMGYGTHLGFRAGTGQAFKWYNVAQERTGFLLVYPFCFMDSTAHYEEGLNVDEAFKSLGQMTQKLKETNSRLTTVFHNFSLGTDAEWKGWAENYEAFIKAV